MGRAENTASSGVYEQLRSWILSGRFMLGERLLEEDLARDLGVSRTPVREALGRLGAEGLVDIRPGRGATVTRWSDTDVSEVYELRAILEGHAAYQAALDMDDETVQSLRKICETERHLLDHHGRGYRKSVAAVNQEFHLTIAETSANTRLTALLRPLIEYPSIMHSSPGYSEERLRHNLYEHLSLVSAFQDRNPPWALSIMRAHMLAERALLADDSRTALNNP